MQFAPRLMPRPSDSHDHPTPPFLSLSGSLVRPDRFSRIRVGFKMDVFYGCGDGLMDFEVPDAISAQAGGLKVKQHRRETFKGRDSQAKGK